MKILKILKRAIGAGYEKYGIKKVRTL